MGHGVTSRRGGRCTWHGVPTGRETPDFGAWGNSCLHRKAAGVSSAHSCVSLRCPASFLPHFNTSCHLPAPFPDKLHLICIQTTPPTLQTPPLGLHTGRAHLLCIQPHPPPLPHPRTASHPATLLPALIYIPATPPPLSSSPPPHLRTVAPPPPSPRPPGGPARRRRRRRTARSP